MCFGQVGVCAAPFKTNKPLLFKPSKMSVRRSGRAAAAAAAAAEEAAKPKPISVEEIRGVTVTTWADKVVVSEGMYTTVRYADRLAAAGGKWVEAESAKAGSVGATHRSEKAWHLPADADVRFILSPAAKPRPSWVCCEKAEILSHKNKHYSCKEHTMYWEECPGPDGQMIKILYAASTCGGSPYTGT
jgi:hypothetical protein